MKRARDIERMVQDLRQTVDAQAHDRIVGHLLDTLKRHQPTTTVARQPYTGRIIMKSPMAKLAVAAVIIVAVVLGLFEFISTDTGLLDISAHILWNLVKLFTLRANPPDQPLSQHTIQ